ncbi:MAG TPA: YbjQ family protein [Gemmatimonadaceae bacterium]|nr:YbjQ family protein [Gemmatimonadaceae bacterium]
MTTTDSVPGKRIVRVLGLVRGNVVRARHIGRDITALLRNVAGGEIIEYTKLLAESCEQSIDRMVEEAERLGGNAIIAMRFSTSMIMAAAAEILCYGTAVVLEDTRE